MKKYTRAFCLIMICSLYTVFAMELQIQGHFDTYNEENIGVSFSFSEQLTNNLYIDAELLYKNSGSYLAYCSGKFAIKQFLVKTGIAYDIMDGLISPGFITTVQVRPFNILSITADILSTFSPENLYNLCIFDIDSGITFHLKNSNTKLLLGYRKEALSINTKEYFSGTFDIVAFESGLPFRIGLNSVTNIIIPNEEIDDFDITIDVGGRLELYTARWGMYFVSAGARLLTYSQPTADITWDVSAGISFQIY